MNYLIKFNYLVKFNEKNLQLNNSNIFHSILNIKWILIKVFLMTKQKCIPYLYIFIYIIKFNIIKKIPCEFLVLPSVQDIHKKLYKMLKIYDIN